MTVTVAFVLGFGSGLATAFCVTWGFLMRPSAQPLPTDHDWRWGASGPRRCGRCYETEGSQQPRCPGRPTPIVIDAGAAGRATDG